MQCKVLNSLLQWEDTLLAARPSLFDTPGKAIAQERDFHILTWVINSKLHCWRWKGPSLGCAVQEENGI